MSIAFNISHTTTTPFRYGNEPDVVEVSEPEILEKASHLKIQNLQPFFNSELFKGNKFTYDSKRKLVVLSM